MASQPLHIHFFVGNTTSTKGNTTTHGLKIHVLHNALKMDFRLE